MLKCFDEYQIQEEPNFAPLFDLPSCKRELRRKRITRKEL